MKTCIVAFATPSRQLLWTVTVEDAATVDDVLAAARSQSGETDVPWDADVGIFGESCERSAVPRDGDRIEIYRPLKWDPKETRRARATARQAERGSAVPRPCPRSSSRRD